MKNKLTKLKGIIARAEFLGVAFSGGIDSSLLLKIASEILPGQAWACFAESDLLSHGERENARKLSAEIGVPLHVIEFDPLSLKSFRMNPLERCYICKKELYKLLWNEARLRGCRTLVDGTNADDRNTFRPGMKAAAELSVSSPLAESGFTKDEIRFLSRMYNLPTWNKPSSPCLATRFPYGQELTLEGLDKVRTAENYLHEMGYLNVRVRCIENRAVVELEDAKIDEFLAKDRDYGILESVRSLGFCTISIDSNGLRSGRFDESVIPQRVGEFSKNN